VLLCCLLCFERFERPQASHRNACQHALRMTRLRPGLVALPDLHAANLFLQGYSTLQIAADGKLPKITSLLHVEAFHMLAQNQDQADKVGWVLRYCVLHAVLVHATCLYYCQSQEEAGRQGSWLLFVLLVLCDGMLPLCGGSPGAGRQGALLFQICVLQAVCWGYVPGACI
jgi:hypothetical protein